MISVVITLYNLETYIHKCIDSVLNQTYNDLEIIVVNDCSTDNSKKEVEKYNDKRIKLINNKENVGAGMSRRIGIQNCHGEYVMLLDADDYIAKDYINSLYENNDGVDIISGGVTCIEEDNKNHIISKSNGIFEGDDKFKNELDGTTVCFLNNKLVKRSLYNIVEYNDKRFIEDTPVLMKLLYYANKSKYIDNPGYYYTQRKNSLMHSADRIKHFVFLTLYFVEMTDFFKDKPDCYLYNVYNIDSLKQLILSMEINNFVPENFIDYKNEWNYIVNYIRNYN